MPGMPSTQKKINSMNFLTRILAVDVPPNMSLQSAELSFRGMSAGWLVFVFLLVVIGIASVVFFYLLEKGTLNWIRRAFLIGLRCGLLFFLLFLILRPILLVEFKGNQPRGVAFLIDNSQSMTQRDRRLTDGDRARVAISHGKLPLDTKITDKMPSIPDAPKDPSRVEMVKAILNHPELRLVPSLEKRGPLRPYFFGSDLQGTRDVKGDLVENLIASFSASDSKTALADSIVKILESKDAELPAAIVAFSDGQDNASKYTLIEAAEKCAIARVPLHLYGVGTSEGATLQIKELGAPDTLFVDDNVTVPLRWRAQGFKKGTAELTLTLGGKVIEKRKLNLQTGEDLRDAVGFVVPKDPEKRETQDLVATIEYRSGNETFKDTLKRTIRVADTKIKILYIENSPRWEYKFLQPALLRDRRIEPEFILVNAAPEVAKSGKPFVAEFPKTREKFFEAKYNLLILGDVPSGYFSKEQQEWIREFVQNRGGLIVMAGRQNMPASYENTPIGELLPVEFKKEKFGIDAETRTQEYPPTLTNEGLRTDWLALADTAEENLDVWQKKLMGFHWNYPVTKLKPAATALLVNPRAPKIGEPPTPMPILATHNFGKGQVLWLGTDESWRWRWNYQDKYFVRFWGQLIYQLGLPSLLGDSTKRSQMALEHSQATVGKQSTVYVRLLDKDFNPRKDAKVEAELDHVDAKPGEERKTPIVLNAISGRPGEYAVLLPNNRPGRFELHVKNPELNTFSFRVELPAKHELEESGMNEKALRDAAMVSGGRFYREEDLGQLASSIASQSKEVTMPQEVLLWNPLAILVFLALITMEWLIRKFSDLS